MNLNHKFENTFTYGNTTYVNASHVNAEYKKSKGHSRSTQITMIHALGIHDYIITNRKGPRKILHMDITSPEFKPMVMNVFINLCDIKDVNLLDRIREMPDADQSYDYDSDTTQPEYETAAIVMIEELELVKLKDNEQFKDLDGNIFPIEIRCKNGTYGSYYKATDIASYLGIDSIPIHNSDLDFELGKSYIFAISERPNEDIYLTFEGLIQLAVKIRYGNGNRLVILNNVFSPEQVRALM